MTKRRNIFISGFPNPVAKNLAKGFVESGAGVRLLAKPDHLDRARKFAKTATGDLSVIEGQLGQIDLGLAGPEYLDLANELTDIVYADLPLPPGIPDNTPPVKWRVREIVELALANQGVSRVFFLSHFDVAGDAPGLFAEQDLSVGQHFWGSADAGRFRGERILGRFNRDVPITIIRSGWIVGWDNSTCPLVELLLAQEDLSSISEKALMGPLPFIDVPGISHLIGGLVRSDGDTDNSTWHVSFKDTPPLKELVSIIRSVAEEEAPAGMDVTHEARQFLRKSPLKERWQSREFIKHIQSGTRIANGKTIHCLKNMGTSLPLFEKNIHRLVREAMARWKKRPSA